MNHPYFNSLAWFAVCCGMVAFAMFVVLVLSTAWVMRP